MEAHLINVCERKLQILSSQFKVDYDIFIAQ